MGGEKILQVGRSRPCAPSGSGPDYCPLNLKKVTVWCALDCVVVTQAPLHGIRVSQRELHQMNVPDVKAESQNASIRNE